MRKPLLLVCAVALVLAAAGCGSSGSEGADGTTTTKADGAATTTAADDGTTSTTEGGDVTPTDVTAEEYAAAIATGLSSGKADDGDLVLPKATAECVAPKWVATITVETLNQAGLTEEEAAEAGFEPGDLGLDLTQGTELVEAFGACDFDIYAELGTALTAGLGEDVQQCTAENLDHDLADAMLAKTFSTGENDAEFEALLDDLRTTCDLPAN